MQKSSRNKTITIEDTERNWLLGELLHEKDVSSSNYLDKIITGDCLNVLPNLPNKSVDLVIFDPPYNIRKQVGDLTFCKKSVPAYTQWLLTFLDPISKLLKPTGTIYLCGDWYTSLSLFEAASQFFKIRNRITWERKAPGAKTNWKNAHEDVWFCTMSDEYTFNLESIKNRKKVLFPYKIDGQPTDWTRDEKGQAWRDEYPSNLWTDITPPFWSMPENTEHPTQKSEKFAARLILASSNPGDVVLSPCLGSGTDAVVAKKLGRHFIGIELQERFALVAQKRLNGANDSPRISGYHDGVFWERNAFRS